MIRVLHVSDLHVEAPPGRVAPGVMSWLADDQRELAESAAELVLATGDLATFGGFAVDDLKLARRWLDGLGQPYLAIPGNHDLSREGSASEESDPRAPLAETNFGQVFGPDALVAREVGPALAVGIAMRPGDPDRVVPQLEEVVGARDRPVILCGHYPLVPVREHGVLHGVGSEKFAGGTADAVLDVIARHRNIVLYACGHIHASSAKKLTDWCWQISAGSLGQGSASYHTFDIGDRGLVARTALGHGPLGFWDKKFPEHHYTPEYHLGEADERTLRIAW